MFFIPHVKLKLNIVLYNAPFIYIKGAKADINEQIHIKNKRGLLFLFSKTNENISK